MPDQSNATGHTTRANYLRRWEAFEALPAELRHYLHGAITALSAAQVLSYYRRVGLARTLHVLREAEKAKCQELNSETWTREWPGQVEPLRPNWPMPATSYSTASFQPTTQDLGL